MVELLASMVIGSLVLASLFTVTLLGIKHYKDLEKEQVQIMELETLRQFINESCVMAETICLYGIPLDEEGNPIGNTPIDLTHKSHNETGEEAKPNRLYALTEIIFNAKAVNQNTLSRATKMVRIGSDMIYQTRQLASDIIKWEAIKKGDAYYMVIGMAQEEGGIAEVVYQLPIKNKDERSEAWVIAE